MAPPEGDATIDDTAAGIARDLAIDFRVKEPFFHARLCINCVDFSPGAGGIDDAINHDGCGFKAAVRLGVVIPG